MKDSETLRDEVIKAFFTSEDLAPPLKHYLVTAPNDISKIDEIFKNIIDFTPIESQPVSDLVYKIVEDEYFKKLWSYRNLLLGEEGIYDLATLKTDFKTQITSPPKIGIDKDYIITEINTLAATLSQEFTEKGPIIASFGFAYKAPIDKLDIIYKELLGGKKGSTFLNWAAAVGNKLIDALSKLIQAEDSGIMFMGNSLVFENHINDIKESITEVKKYDWETVSDTDNDKINIVFSVANIEALLKKVFKDYKDAVDKQDKQELEKKEWNKKKELYGKNKGSSKYVYEISNSLDIVPFSFFNITPIYGESESGYKKVNSFIPSPSMNVIVQQNTKTNIYKNVAPKVLFQFDPPILISFGKVPEVSGYSTQTDGDKTLQQVFFQNSQPNKIFVYRFEADDFNIGSPLLSDKPRRVLDINQEGLWFYEEMEVNKDYYYFYHAYPEDISEKNTKIVNDLYVTGIAEGGFSTPLIVEYLINFFAIGSLNKIRLVKDENFYYLEREPVVPSSLAKKYPEQVFRNKLFVSPQLLAFTEGKSTFDNGAPYIKLRIKSKKTNKKIDLNLKYTTIPKVLPKKKK